MTSRDQYIKALKVLHRVGGTFQGVGFEDKYLLVSETQYKALVEANVITPEDTEKDPKRGKNSRKNAKS
jgi:hypothetical protein